MIRENSKPKEQQASAVENMGLDDLDDYFFGQKTEKNKLAKKGSN
jgi:hypothetical protein